MKRFLLILACIFWMGVDVAAAQENYPVFSAALGGGAYSARGVRRSVYRPRGGIYTAGDSNTTVFAGGSRHVAKPSKKIILKYHTCHLLMN